ncbi:hypothetical protein P7K49_009499 [Saguinus oedipus]|uniref:Uncharacterized protein n=1 Tax=Saguinus oedipus TaxID=9490 RepID=A0ABQ9VK51_SAGOE|nr:hypothetical protein P7K49_009499 [Saguinus oedipus]
MHPGAFQLRSLLSATPAAIRVYFEGQAGDKKFGSGPTPAEPPRPPGTVGFARRESEPSGWATSSRAAFNLGNGGDGRVAIGPGSASASPLAGRSPPPPAGAALPLAPPSPIRRRPLGRGSARERTAGRGQRWDAAH